MNFKPICFLLFLGCALPAFSQVNYAKQLEMRLNNYLSDNIQHKVFVQTNANNYQSGDTLWFKASVTNAINHVPASSEKLIYIDLISPDNKVLVHQVFYLFGGFTAGSIPINRAFSYGTYKLVAYTNYMRNYSSEFFFQKEIEILEPSNKLTEWNFNQQVTPVLGGDSVSVWLLAQTVPGREINHSVDITVQLGRGTMLGGKANMLNNTGKFSFFVPDSLKIPQATLNLSAPNEPQNTTRYRIELSPTRPDLQFLPESGWLIAQHNNHVAISCNDAMGKPLSISGTVFNKEKVAVAEFNTEIPGAGLFSLPIIEPDTFYAEIDYKGHKFKYNLPPVYPRAYALYLIENNTDSLVFSIIRASNTTEEISILCHTRGIINYLATGQINQTEAKVSIPKNAFHGGVTVFTLIARNFPIAERLVYIEPKNVLQLSVTPDKYYLNKREKVDFSIKANHANGTPAIGSFSLNAFDLHAGLGINKVENISTYMNLISDLTGKIDHYIHLLNPKSQTYYRDIDLLMLTHGWRRFKWTDIHLGLEQEKNYKIEKGLSLKGEVRRAINNKPVPKNFEVTISLKQQTVLFVDKAKTDEHGRFSFELPEFTDSANLIIQTKNRLGKKNNYIIDVYTNLEHKNINHISFTKVKNVTINPVLNQSATYVSKNMETKNDERPVTTMKPPRVDNYYFPGRDTFMIEEVDVRSDFLSKRDSLIFKTGEPDVIIEAAQLQRISEQTPWYSNIWDLIDDQIPGLMIQQRAYDPNLAKRHNLVIGTQDHAVYFKVAGNTEGRLLIAVDGEFLGRGTVKMYDFLTLMDPSEIESINFIARPKNYENATYDYDIDLGFSEKSFNVVEDPTALSSELNDALETSENPMAGMFLSNGSAGIQTTVEYMEELSKLTAPPSYLFVTTKSKQGIMANKPKGINTINLQGLSKYREFYSPNYTATNNINSDIADQRKTIHWDPNIVTDAQGEAKLSFFASDLTNPIGVMVQGLSINGQTGWNYLELNADSLAQPQKPSPKTQIIAANNTISNEMLKSLKLITGRISDQETKHPVPAANLFQENPYYHTACNLQGEFFIEIEQIKTQEPILISAPGYKSITIKPEMLNNEFMDIQLEKEAIHSPQLAVNTRNIVRQAIRNSARMYSSEAVYQGYFREAIAVDNNYYSINESTFNYTNQGKAGRINALIYETERFKTMEDRNGHKLLMLKPNHRNRFYPLNTDIISSAPAFWDFNTLNHFSYQLAGEISINGKTCYKIVFDHNEDIIQPLEKGILFIEKESLLLVAAQWEISPNSRKYLSYVKYLHSNPMNFSLEVVSTNYQVNYLHLNGKLILQSGKEEIMMEVDNKEMLKFERQISVQGESMKNSKQMTNATINTLTEAGKATRMQVKDARYMVETWVRNGIIKPEGYLITDAKFMHDITFYR